MDTNKVPKPSKGDGNNKKNPLWYIISIILLFAVLFGVYNFEFFNKEKEEEVYKSYPELESIITERVESEKIHIKENTEGKVVVTIGEEEEESDVFVTQVNPRESSIKNLIDTYEIEYEYAISKNFVHTIFNFIFYGFIIAIVWFMLIPMMKTRSPSTSTKKSNIKPTSFDDIGGLSEEALSEILQVELLLKNPSRAERLGIPFSKGVLLHGPSGTGKTLVAKALAHSLDAEFISAEGPSFVEMFAGLGAKRVRELFHKAQKHKRAVIFIDEIDAVGKKRSSGGPKGNDEQEQSLNQLLVCMDGLEKNDGIFVVAATNRLDILDEALTRPGRFDSKIMMDLPDLEGRREIIKIHTKNKPLDSEVVESIEDIAQSTIGYSGADIESLFNKAAFNAFMENRETITMTDVNSAIDRLLLGLEGKKTTNTETLKRIAYHEAGHAIVTSIVKPNSIRKASIIPRGHALGFVVRIPNESLSNIKELKDNLKIMVAGGVAEQLIFGNHSSGVADDFKRTKELIERMVHDWGMGQTPLIPSFSEKEKYEQMKELYEETIYETQKLVELNFEFFEATAQLLLEKETVDGKEIESLKEKIEIHPS